MPPNLANRARSVAQIHRNRRATLKAQHTDDENAEDFQEMIITDSKLTPFLTPL